MQPANIFITGVAGFIGSHCAEALQAAGHSIVGIDNFSPFYDPEIKRRNLNQFQNQIRFYEGDIRDAALLEKIFTETRPRIVLHLAAMAGVRPSFVNPALYTDVNLNGTNAVFRAAHKHGVEKILYASSSSVYGNNPKVPFSESANIDHPISIYAATKRANEKQALTWYNLSGIPTAGLRFFTVYGPRQRPEMAIHKFTRALLAGEVIQLYGDGQTYRDYTYIDDIVAGVLAVMDGIQALDIVNLGESQTTKLIDLIQLLETATGKRANLEFYPSQKGDVDRTFADISHARKTYGYVPETNMSSGLKSFVEWYRNFFL